MNADAMATRMSVLNRALPRRILIVDDDELNLDLLSDRLRTAGFDVERAMNGEEALGRLQQQWFPVVITDWQMPVMDGIALTQALRARGVDDTYVIMLTMREAGPDYERGYLAGVDDYLTKRLPDAELFARIHVAFNTLALRRSLKEARDALEHNAPITPIDADSSAFTTQELQSRLQSEIKRARRYGRQLSVMTMGMSGAAQSLTAETLQSIVRTLRTVIRSDVDWIGRMAGTNNDVTFAIVLPEAGSADGPAIKSRLEDALLPFAAGNQPVSFRFGFASVQRTDMGAHIGGEAVDAGDLLGVAGQCRGCPGHAGAEQLSTVQFSIKSHVAIACRHGYSVDRYCTLKTVTAAVNRPFAASTRTH